MKGVLHLQKTLQSCDTKHSMYAIFVYIGVVPEVNVGIYTC